MKYNIVAYGPGKYVIVWSETRLGVITLPALMYHLRRVVRMTKSEATAVVEELYAKGKVALTYKEAG